MFNVQFQISLATLVSFCFDGTNGIEVEKKIGLPVPFDFLGFKCLKQDVEVQDWISDEEMQCRVVNQTSCFQIMTTKYKTIRV
jgi:hypothetical protein